MSVQYIFSIAGVFAVAHIYVCVCNICAFGTAPKIPRSQLVFNTGLDLGEGLRDVASGTSLLRDVESSRHPASGTDGIFQKWIEREIMIPMVNDNNNGDNGDNGDNNGQY